MSFDSVLEEFRDEEKQSCVLHLHTHQSLLMASAWPKVGLTLSRSRSKPPEQDNERWVWLWKQVAFDIEEWARIAAVALPNAKAIAHALVANAVVYPDGTINSFATSYIEDRTMKMLDAK